MNPTRFVILTWSVAFVLVLNVLPATASNTSAVMATVHQFIDNLNQGDAKKAIAACASPASIVDEFAPHTWQGPHACADWLKAFEAASASASITDSVVTLHTPWHVDVSGDRAYAVVPADYTYKDHGKQAKESGSILTVVLKRSAAVGWRIIAWTWAKH